MLNEPGKAPSSTSYMWLYRTGRDAERHIIIFEYQPSRSHVHPKNFLRGFKGLLHADGYDAYRLLPNVTVVGCWAHLRRKMMDALKVIPAEHRPSSIAQKALDKIGYLFHLEDVWRHLDSEKRQELRLSKSKPLAEEFFAWLEKQNILPKSATGRAVGYALEQRKWLMNVYLDWRTELSNNRIENNVRPLALGRKNWLFSATEDGANASAIVFSLIETAKANGLKPFEYLEFLFETLPNATSNAIDSLLPWGEAVPSRCRMPLAIGGAACREKVG